MERHTQGEWEVVAGTSIEVDGLLIAKVPERLKNDHEDGFFETRANAKLIAAAPNMLSGLEMAAGFISGFEDDQTQEGIPFLLATIRAAIGKAKDAA